VFSPKLLLQKVKQNPKLFPQKQKLMLLYLRATPKNQKKKLRHPARLHREKIHPMLLQLPNVLLPLQAGWAVNMSDIARLTKNLYGDRLALNGLPDPPSNQAEGRLEPGKAAIRVRPVQAVTAGTGPSADLVMDLDMDPVTGQMEGDRAISTGGLVHPVPAVRAEGTGLLPVLARDQAVLVKAGLAETSHRR